MNQPILQVPHDALRQVADKITDFHSEETQSQINSLTDTIKSAKEPEGVGLAFPQIGINLRGFVTYLPAKPGLPAKTKLYLNPQIIDQDDKTTLGGRTPDRPTLEGCLSIPWLYGPVYRSKKIKISAHDEHGVEFQKTLSSFRARLFLHELDHLEGVLFTDYTTRDSLPLFMFHPDTQEFTPIEDPSAVIKW
jgi:peptide deformylase